MPFLLAAGATETSIDRSRYRGWARSCGIDRRGNYRAAGWLPACRCRADQARRLDGEAGAQVTYRAGWAEGTGLEAASWGVVAAGSAGRWFDRPRVAAEARRLLVPGGAFLICRLNYLALPGNVCSATE